MIYKKVCFFVLILLFQTVIVSCTKKIDKSKFEFERTREYKDYSYGIITGSKPIVWGTSESTKMIKTTMYSKPFFKLLPHYASQLYMSTCGMASSRIVLSAIYESTNTPFPIDYQHSNIEEENGVTGGKFIFTEKAVMDVYKGDDEDKQYDIIARLKKRKEGKFNGGIDIDKLTEVLNLHPHVNAEYFIVDSSKDPKIGIQEFRKVIKDVMLSDDKYMIANYHLGAMYPYTSGHFSPVVAYHEQSDRVLIMDVAGYLGTWVWIKVEELYKSMNSVLSKVERGYIVITQVDNNDNNDKQ